MRPSARRSPLARASARTLALGLALCLAQASPLSAQAPEDDADAPQPQSPPKVLASLVAKEANRAKGAKGTKGTKGAKKTESPALPAGSDPSEGAWTFSPEYEAILLHPAPLAEGTLEFGPEIRERGAAIIARARAPGDGRLRSRMGVGLYGPNGFQIRTHPALKRLELVRRGEVVTEAPGSVSPEGWYWIELAVEAAADSGAGDQRIWEVSARLWPREGERPADPQLFHRTTSELLRFPLAGRARLVGTAFSGEPVHFSGAEVFDAGYLAHRDSAPPEPKDGDESDDTTDPDPDPDPDAGEADDAAAL